MATHIFNIINQLGGIAMATEPVTIHEYLNHVFMLKNFGVQ